MDQKRKRWIILGGCWLVMAFVFGCGWEPSGVFILPLVKQFGWTRFQVSMLNMALAIALGASCPLVGWLVDRTQAPFWMIFGSAVTGVALLLASIGNSFGALFGAYLRNGDRLLDDRPVHLRDNELVRRPSRSGPRNFCERQFVLRHADDHAEQSHHYGERMR